MLATTDDGCTLAYNVAGTGSDVVLLHGFGGSRRDFQETVAHLDPSAVRAITLDLRGHGDSARPEGGLDLGRAAADALAVAAAAGADRFVAVGHSMGGKIAQYLVHVAPQRVAGLVLVGSPPPSALPAPPSVRAWLDLAGDGPAFLREVVAPYLHRPVDARRAVIESGSEAPAEAPAELANFIEQFVGAAARLPRPPS